MPRGGRRPGAGAPRGNLNAAKTGGRSKRLQIVLAALLSEPEIRKIILGLLLGGEEAHREFRELVVTSARVLYERPINEELRELANRVATAHIEKLGAVGTREAVLQYRGQLGFEDLLPPTRRTPATRRNNPVFRDFCTLLLGIDPARLPPPQSINSDAIATLIPESEDPQFAAAVVRAIRQSNPKSSDPPLREVGEGPGGEVLRRERPPVGYHAGCEYRSLPGTGGSSCANVFLAAGRALSRDARTPSARSSL